MGAHLQQVDGEVKFKTVAGEFTVNMLRLNAPSRVEFRRRTLREYTRLRDLLQQLLSVRKTVRRLASRAAGEFAAQVHQDLMDIDTRVGAIKNANTETGNIDLTYQIG